MSLHVAVDFGTSSTCVALSVHGREPQVVVIDGQPLVPSAVFAAQDGTLFVGHEAERQAAVDPSRYEPNPKRRIDEGELLLGTSVLRVPDVVRAVLTRAVNEARRVAGGMPVDLLVLTHPADWGAIRTRVLLQAANKLANEIRLVPEPVAAAVFHSAGHAMAEGATLAVLDLGAGTVDATVISRQGGAFRVLATKGDPSFGGADVDQLLLEHLGSQVPPPDRDAWRQLVEGQGMVDRRRRRMLRQDVRGAKETLSRHAYTDVPMPPPFRDAHVTRSDLERLISAPLNRAVALVLGAVRNTGLNPRQLTGIFLVGGSSRIPMVARLVMEQSGVVPTSIDQPETVVARGALRAVAIEQAAPPKAVPAEEGTRKITRKIGAPETYRSAFPATPAPGFSRPPQFPVTPPVKKRSHVPLLVGGAVLLVAVIGASVAYAISSNRDTNTAQSSAPKTQESGKQISVYDYSFSSPVDWEQSGGDPTTRKVQVRPAGADSTKDLIAVQEQPLTYDASADRDRAVRELRAEYDVAKDLSDFTPSTSYAGKDVVYYRERPEGLTIDWYVLLKGGAQVSVGCQFTQAGEQRVRSACEQVVRTLTVTS
ncbi:type VII secretion-associated protein [Umezawaea sp. Da 62-37]|uniref:type VII secretion-associated protein n=1 Tax=Umezawaea sp. Da 62-37 TaxID=3075927 RepID=UPI0028F7078E|nr:type VII secretion-associated protein [Umezawaea sp. Da 62-37]WNV90854.1 type VII secretion-associated protein [Umezawaea sp. Da 62-37]